MSLIKKFADKTSVLLKLLINLGFILLIYVYYLSYNGSFHNGLFWISILLCSVSISIEFLNTERSENYKICLLFLYASMLYIMRMLPNMQNFHFGDELYTFESAKLIFEAGTLNVEPHFELSIFYPGIEILVVIAKHFTSLDFLPVSRISVGFIHSAVPIFLYLFFIGVSSLRQIAIVGALIFTVNPLYVFFHATFSYGSLGIFFVIMLIYIIFKRLEMPNNVSFSIITIISLASMVITHHFSSLMFLLFLIILSIFQSDYLKKYGMYKSKNNIKLITLSFTFILSFMIVNGNPSIKYLFRNFVEKFMRIFELSLFGGEKLNLLSSSLSTSSLPIYEYIIDSYIYPALIICLIILGWYIFDKKNQVEYSLFIYGPIIFLISLIFIPTSGSEIATRLWSFAFIGLSFMISIVLEWIHTRKGNIVFLPKYSNLIRQIIILLILFVLIIGGISIGNKPIHRIPSLLSPQFVAGTGSMSTDTFSSAEWSEQKLGRNNRMTSDRGTAVVFIGYSSQDVERWSSWKAFLPLTINSEVIEYLYNFKIKYIIVDSRLAISLAEFGYYFDKKEIYSRYYPQYGLTEKLPFECLTKFDNYIMVSNIYDNGNIDTYQLSGRSQYG